MSVGILRSFLIKLPRTIVHNYLLIIISIKRGEGWISEIQGQSTRTLLWLKLNKINDPRTHKTLSLLNWCVFLSRKIVVSTNYKPRLHPHRNNVIYASGQFNSNENINL